MQRDVATFRTPDCAEAPVSVRNRSPAAGEIAVFSQVVRLSASSIALRLGAAAFLLVAVSTGLQITAYLAGHHRIFGLVQFFYVDAERNIPTAFSTLLLVSAGLLLALITALTRKQTGSPIAHWAILTLGFFVMAADEAFSFHERWIGSVRKLLGDGDLGIFYFAWVIPGMALVFVLALFFSKFLVRLPGKTRLTLLIAAALYIGGAIGVELIGGRFWELHGPHNLTYSMIATVEESLEMAGILTLIWALLVYIAREFKEVRFRFE